MVDSYQKRKAGSKRPRKPSGFRRVYAVGVGRDGPGIYRTLEEFKANIIGRPGGTGGRFGCLKEARNWLSRPVQLYWMSGHVTATVAPEADAPSTSGAPEEMNASEDVLPSPAVIPLTTHSQLNAPEEHVATPVHDHVLPFADLTYSPVLEDVQPAQEVNNSQRLLRAPQHPLYDRMEGVEPLGMLTEYYNALDSMSGAADGSLASEAKYPSIAPPTVRDFVAEFGKNLSAEQRKILYIIAEGKSVFFTGAAGTGKSVTLRAAIAMLKNKYSNRKQALAVTASTGIAALNIDGETLHSFSGIGLGKKPAEKLFFMLKGRTLDKWRKLETLIIDEISMVDGTFFDKLEEIARRVRANKLPFGGIQLVISGDFFQLPPVPDQYKGAAVPACFAFDANSWGRCVTLQMQLRQVYRQADSSFVDILNKMRLGQVDSTLEQQLSYLNRDVVCNGIEPVQLYPRKCQVENANKCRLEALSGAMFFNKASDSGRWLDFELRDQDAHNRRITTLLDKHSIAPGSIEFKVCGSSSHAHYEHGARPIGQWILGRVVALSRVQDARENLIKSIDDLINENLAAEVEKKKVSLEDLRRARRLPESHPPHSTWPIIEFANKEKVLFTPVPFDLEDAYGDLEATRVQVPLILAWAITVHKSQGQTIERLKIDFEGTFEYGQAYVAMSRSTGMETLQVLNFRPMMVKAHPRVLEWYKTLLIEGEMDREEAVAAYFSHC